MGLKITHVSDTHLKQFNPEPADILIHSGDALNYGNVEELVKFRIQLEAVKKDFSRILFVAGNHDRIFEDSPALAEEILKESIDNIDILDSKAVSIKGGLKVYGESAQPYFCNWSFNIKNPHSLYSIYSQIPDDVDILITHCPPKGILDSVYGESVGSIELKAHLHRLKKLKLHCYGHIHFSAGIEIIDGVTYSNGAICNEEYESTNKGNTFELESKNGS